MIGRVVQEVRSLEFFSGSPNDLLGDTPVFSVQKDLELEYHVSNHSQQHEHRQDTTGHCLEVVFSFEVQGHRSAVKVVALHVLSGSVGQLVDALLKAFAYACSGLSPGRHSVLFICLHYLL